MTEEENSAVEPISGRLPFKLPENSTIKR